jgi:hypothetical protein
MCRPKEPRYFLSDDVTQRPAKTLEEYLELFISCTDENLVIGEATPDYINFPESIQRIYNFNPEAKIVVILRNPVDMAQSLHSHHVYKFRETVNDFEEAWRLQVSRANGLNLPRETVYPHIFQYGEQCLMAGKMEKLYRIFPRDQIKVILFDHFSQSPREVYMSTLEFLNIADDGRKSFPRLNAQKAHRIQWVGRLAMKVQSNNFLSAVKNNPATASGLNFYRKMADVRTPRSQVSPRFRAELEKFFREDIAILSDIINKDLSHWSGPS